VVLIGSQAMAVEAPETPPSRNAEQRPPNIRPRDGNTDGGGANRRRPLRRPSGRRSRASWPDPAARMDRSRRWTQRVGGVAAGKPPTTGATYDLTRLSASDLATTGALSAQGLGFLRGWSSPRSRKPTMKKVPEQHVLLEAVGVCSMTMSSLARPPLEASLHTVSWGTDQPARRLAMSSRTAGTRSTGTSMAV
jgi:hypothetical protein